MEKEESERARESVQKVMCRVRERGGYNVFVYKSRYSVYVCARVTEFERAYVYREKECECVNTGTCEYKRKKKRKKFRKSNFLY